MSDVVVAIIAADRCRDMLLRKRITAELSLFGLALNTTTMTTMPSRQQTPPDVLDTNTAGATSTLELQYVFVLYKYYKMNVVDDNKRRNSEGRGTDSRNLARRE